MRLPRRDMPLLLLACSAVLAPIFGWAQGPADPVFAEWHGQVDPAIKRGLDFLADSQREDGSFPDAFGDSTGIPALAGMAILAMGHLPTSGPYQGTLNACIDFILDNQKSDGLFEKGNAGNGPMYAHNISTLFLSEVSGMVEEKRQLRIDRQLPRALALILRAQQVGKDERARGGWRYRPDSTDSDTSCSGWALMALKSAKLNGAPVPDGAIAAAVDYLERHQDEQTGTFGYMSWNDHADSLTGMGLLCLELCGRHGDPRTLKAADYILKTFRKLPSNQFEMYGNYYNAQAMFQVGGHYWATFAPWLYKTYLPKQRADGSWDSHEAGRVYGTSMIILAFSVPWRQLPIYQRDETVDRE